MSELLQVEITESPTEIAEAMNLAYDIGLTANSSWKLIVGLLQTAGYEPHIAAATAYNMYKSSAELEQQPTMIAEEHASFSQEAVEFITGQRPKNLETGALALDKPTIEENVYWSAVVYAHLSKAADPENNPEYVFDSETIEQFRQNYVSVSAVTNLLNPYAYEGDTTPENRLNIAFGVLLDAVVDIQTAQDDNDYRFYNNLVGQGIETEFGLSHSEIDFIKNNSYLPTGKLYQRALLWEQQQQMLKFNPDNVVEAIRYIRETQVDEAAESIALLEEEARTILNQYTSFEAGTSDAAVLIELRDLPVEEWQNAIEDGLFIPATPQMIQELKTLFGLDDLVE